MKILFPESNWASNIGNPFFYLGIAHAVRSALPSAEIIETASNPVLPLKLGKKTRPYAFNYAAFGGEVDALLFTGPMFDLNFREFFEPALRSAKENGQKILLLSAGGIDYDEKEVKHCRDVLAEYKPDVLMTRDPQTYELYGDCAALSYNGVCGAWYAPDYYPGYDTPNLGKYITSCFDFRPELPGEVLLHAADKAPAAIPAPPAMGKTRGRVQRVLARGQSSRIGDYNVVRPCHRPANHPLTVFTQPNTFASYTPFGYLNLYRNTATTVTDRLHAAVVTLAYGNPAYLFLRSKRSYLLDAMNLKYEPGVRLKIDMDLLKAKKAAQVEFLKTALAA